MFKGIAFALSACFIWGLIFIVPQFIESFSSMEIAIGRYLFYGGISLIFFFRARLSGLCRYPLSAWIQALFLSVLSSYYLWVVWAIRYTSPEVCALILGMSPITIALYGNWKQGEGKGQYLIIPSLLIIAGLTLINAPHIAMTTSAWEYAIGLLCSLVALLSWSAYVVLNARFLKKNTHILSQDWATIQGVATLLLVLLCSLVYALSLSLFLGDTIQLDKYFIWNEENGRFLMACATLGLFCSWIGGTLWNKASVHLPVSLAGQLMIFETIFGILFVYILNQQFPSLMELSGVILLLGAIIYGIRTLIPQGGEYSHN